MVQKRPDRTLGPGHDQFWQGCNESELHLQRCKVCGALTWPAANACANCGGTSLSWERMSGRGTLYSWCTFYQDYYRAALPLPWDTILVELEEGPLFVANPHGFSLDDARVGLPVKLAFIACEDSAGPFNLPVFELAEVAPA